MSNQPKIYKYKDLSGLAARLRGDLVEHDFVLLYAHNVHIYLDFPMDICLRKIKEKRK